MIKWIFYPLNLNLESMDKTGMRWSVLFLAISCLCPSAGFAQKENTPALEPTKRQDDSAAAAELKWKAYSEKEFTKNRFSAPTVIVIMKDLCPGCRAKRDALWSNPAVKKQVTLRGMNLFRGNAAEEKGLQAAIEEKFKVKTLPVVIIHSKQMADKPLILPGTPEPAAVVKALQKKLPIPMGN